MKKLLTLLLALTGFAFSSCDRENDYPGDHIICLYGIRTATYEEKNVTDEDLPVVAPEQATQGVDFEEETLEP